MKNRFIISLAVVITIGLSSCGGDDDMMNGAIAHGEKLGAKKCECATAEPQEAMKCVEERLSMIMDYEAFLETAKEGGSDMDALQKAFDEAFELASKECD